MATLERVRSSSIVSRAEEEDLEALRAGVPTLPPANFSSISSETSVPNADYLNGEVRREASGFGAAGDGEGATSGSELEPPLTKTGSGELDPHREASRNINARILGEDTVFSLQSAKTAFVSVLVCLLNPPATGAADTDIASGPASLDPVTASSAEPVDAFAVAAAQIAASHPSAAAMVSSRISTDQDLASGKSSQSLATLLALTEATASTLPSATDVSLANTLGTLLKCLDRLLTLGNPSATDSVLASRNQSGTNSPTIPPADSVASMGVYEVLQREARALGAENTSRLSPQATGLGAPRRRSNSAKNQMEAAEIEFLWGQVDDLLDAVSDLCRERVEARSAQPPADSNVEVDDPFADTWAEGTHRPSETASMHSMESELPVYEAGLPDYEDRRFSGVGTKKSRGATEREALHPTASISEKMHYDLDLISSAIERLYRCSPQLANQRASLSASTVPTTAQRKQLRDKQLESLFTAVERFSGGRLEDQCAQVPDAIAEGVIGMGWDGKGREKGKARELRDVKELMERIERAQERRLDEQRAVKPGTLRTAGAGVGTKEGRSRGHSIPLRISSEEQERRHIIMSKTGKGRMDSQDAHFTMPNSSSMPSDPTSPASPTGGPVDLADFLRSDGPRPWLDGEDPEDKRLRELRARNPRSRSVPEVSPLLPQISPAPPPPSAPSIKKRISRSVLMLPSSVSSGSGNGVGSAISGEKSPSRSLFFGIGRSSPAGSRRSSVTGARASAEALAGERGRGVMMDDVEWKWIAEGMKFLGSVGVVLWQDTYDAGSSSAAAVVVKVENFEKEMLEVTCDGQHVKVGLEGLGELDATIPPVIIQRSGVVELKLRLVRPSTSRPTPTFPRSPFSASELTSHQPTHFNCRDCGNRIVDVKDRVNRWKALPSEHWHELLDAWMCHPDEQVMSEDVVGKGKKDGWSPGVGEGLVGDRFLMVLSGGEGDGWRAREGVQSKVIDDEVWDPIECAPCCSLLGLLSADSRVLRLSKLAMVAPGLDYSLDVHVSSQLLELGEAHGSYRFLVESEEEGQVALAIWLFTPSFYVASSSKPCLHAVKVFYLPASSDAAFVNFTSQPHLESISLPQETCSRLIVRLQQTTTTYPPAQRKFGAGFYTGYLERL